MILFAIPALAIALLADPDATILDAAGMPTRICNFGGWGQFWVGAATALTADGKPDRTQFDNGGIDGVEWILKQPEIDGCAEFGSVILDGVAHDHERETLDDVAETATSILEGIVDGVAPGFYAGIPGQLYRVRPRRVLKGELDRDTYYFFLPMGRIPLGSMTVCETEPKYPVAPVRGLRVLLMTDSWAGPDKEFLVVEQPEDIVIEKGDSSAAIAAALVRRQPEVANVSFDQFVADIQDRLDVIAARSN